MRIPLFSVSILAMAACAQGGPSTETDIEGSCEALAAAEAGLQSGAVKAVSAQSGPTGTVVTLSVDNAAEPWLCRVDASGVILGISPAQ
ncbi:hypothetical protein [Ruegeria sp.]|uniref:hypothetical protein n=1 Tax=Ruegeria sp. TaxID=1879320 RepID=UPI002320655C|nr:hypothetical protein [Ruegeria sp.]MDA7964809.1 hypothetical protein [Ruegeria sp.]